MSNTPETDLLLADLDRVLGVHGGDRKRWPAGERLRFASLIATDPRARAAVAEATALDRLLDRAPTVSVERERALAVRILAAAGPAQIPLAAPAARVVAVPRQPVSKRFAGALRGPAAALLAASLVMGVIVGSSGYSGAAVTYVAEAVGLADDEPELAFASDSLPSGEEAL